MFDITTPILISGDSWACGEWTHSTISHKGIEQYFIDNGFSTTNISISGSNNRVSIIQLKNYVDKVGFNGCIIWFQTEILRDLYFSPDELKELNWKKIYSDSADVNWPPLPSNIFEWELLPDIVKSKLSFSFNYFDYTETPEWQHKILNPNTTILEYDDLLNYRNYRLLKTYQQLNSIGIPILCIGGLSMIDTSLIQNFKNLITVVPSISTYLTQIDHPYIDVSGIKHLKQLVNNHRLSIECCQHLLNNNDIFNEIFNNTNWFQHHHLNKHGHKKLFDLLILDYFS